MSYSSHPPVGNTCPLIDEIIEGFSDFKIEVTYEIKNKFEDLSYIVENMEKLRSANSDLRDWGNSLVLHIGELEKQIEVLEANQIENE